MPHGGIWEAISASGVGRNPGSLRSAQRHGDENDGRSWSPSGVLQTRRSSKRGRAHVGSANSRAFNALRGAGKERACRLTVADRAGWQRAVQAAQARAASGAGNVYVTIGTILCKPAGDGRFRSCVAWKQWGWVGCWGEQPVRHGICSVREPT